MVCYFAARNNWNIPHSHSPKPLRTQNLWVYLFCTDGFVSYAGLLYLQSHFNFSFLSIPFPLMWSQWLLMLRSDAVMLGSLGWKATHSVPGDGVSIAQWQLNGTWNVTGIELGTGCLKGDLPNTPCTASINQHFPWRVKEQLFWGSYRVFLIIKHCYCRMKAAFGQ